MREKCYTNPQRGGAGVLWKGIKALLVLVALFGTSSIYAAGTPNFPFPQNYTYPHGVLPANYKLYNDQLKTKYNQFMDAYYEDGMIDGVPCGRLKFKQVGETGDATVSEGVAYGMLLTVYMAGANGDQEYDRFKRLWNYYKKNSNGHGIMNWKVDRFTGKVVGGIADNANGAPDAEIDAAQALLMAYKQWGDASFLSDAETLMSAIWDHEIDHKFVIKAGDYFDDYKNPCYFVTNAIQLFANVDDNPAHQWGKVVDASYSLIKKVQNKNTGLIPDWVYNDANYSYIKGIEKSKFSSHYLYDAVRVQWRMAQAHSWYGHTDAKDISSALTAWAVAQSSNEPKNMKDGYTLSGGVPHDASIPYFKDKGLWSNACFTGGFASGGLVDSKFQTFIDRGYSSLGTDYADESSYFVDATHLLFMLFMGGNMPNLYDMLPDFVSAETNADGSAILVKFSKEINQTTVAASLSGWSVKSDFGNVTNVISSAVAVDAKTVKLNFADVIEDEYQIVSYNGTGGLKSIEGSKLNQFSTDLSVLDNTGLQNYRAVTDLRTNKRPIITQAVTSQEGNKIILLFDQDLLGVTATNIGFTVTANGTAKTISSFTYDILEPNKLVLVVGTADFSTWIGEGDDLLLSYSGNKIASVNRQRVKIFTSRLVRNNTVVQKCNLISSFESAVIPGGAWVSPFDLTEKWNMTAVNPKPASTVNPTATCVEYVRTAKSDMASAPKFKFNANMHSSGAINTLLQEGQTLFTFKLYAPNCAGSVIKLGFYDNKDDEWWEKPYLDYSYTIPAAATTGWVEVSIDMDNDKDFKGVVNAFELAIDKGVAGAGQKVYLDEFNLCSPVPSTEIRGAMVNYDGKAITVTFGNDMNLPANAGDFEIGVKTGTTITYQKATSVAFDPDNSRKLVLGTAFTISASQKSIYIKYVTGTVASLDGRALVSFMDYPVVNAVGRAITRGWRDDFEDLNDNVTKSLGAATSIFTLKELSDGTFSVKSSTVKPWNSFSVTVADELWDLSKNQKVTVRVKSADAFYLRVDMKDLTNQRNTDMVEIQKYTGAGQWQEMSFDITGLWKNVYTEPGAVNSEAIYQVLFYPWSELSSAANAYAPPTYTGELLFDYISIGASVLVNTDATPLIVGNGKTVDAGSSAKGWSSVDNAVIYTVPLSTIRSISSLEEMVTSGQGVKVNAPAKGEKYDLGIKNLTVGSYCIYAYEPATGAISIKMDLTLKDVTPPVLTYSLPNLSLVYESNSVVQVRMNEPGYVVMVAGDVDPTTLTGQQILSSTYAKAILTITEADVDINKPLVLSDVSGAAGYKIFAMDIAGHLSDITPVFMVQDTKPPVVSVITTTVPWLFDNPSDTDTECQDIDALLPYNVYDIEFTVNKKSEAFLVSAGTTPQFIKTADQNTLGVINFRTVTISNAITSMSTDGFVFANCFYGGDFRPGEYWVYARDENNNVSEPVSVFVGVDASSFNDVASIAISPSAPAAITVSGGTSVLSLSITGVDAGKPANIASVVWSSSKTTVASLSNSTNTGTTITAVGNGTTTIKVVVTDASNNVLTKTVEITVNIPATPATITVTSGLTMDLVPSQTADITASVTPLAASQDFEISSTSSAITTLGNTIIAGAVSEVTVADVLVFPVGFPALAKTVKVTITPATKPLVSLSPSVAQTVKVGAILELTATVTNATDKKVTWESSSEPVASVSAGTVKAIFPGSAVITVTSVEDPTSKATISVSVVKKDPSVLSLNVSDLTFIAGSTEGKVLSAVFGSNDEAMTTDLGLTWKSSDPSVATVDATGKVTLATGASAGATAVITVTSKANSALSASATVSISSNEILLTGITVTPTLALGIDETGTISVIYVPASSTQQGVSFVSSNQNVVSVNPATGAYEAIGAGTATITVTSTKNPAITASISVTVKAAIIETVTVADATVNLDMKDATEKQISASFIPEKAPNDLVYNVVSGTAVSVSPTGLATAVSVGTAIVRVSSLSNPSAYAEVVFTVAAAVIPVASIELSTGYATSVRSDDVVNLAGYITVNPITATNQNVILAVSPASAATINGTSFTVSPAAKGTFTVTVRSSADASISATATFTVIDPVSSVTIVGESDVVPGGTISLTATVTGGSDQGVTWTVVGSGITISTAGVVSVGASVAPGKYQVKATSLENAGVFGSKTINVTAKTGTLTGITLPSSLTVASGKTIAINATTDPLSFNGIAEWSITSGPGTLSSSTGKTVEFTAGSSIGTAQVTVTMEGLTSNVCTITIVAEIKPITGVSQIKALPVSIDAGEKINLSDYFGKMPASAGEDLIFSVTGGSISGTTATAGSTGNLVITVGYPAKPIGNDYVIKIISSTVLLEDIILTGADSDIIVAKSKTSAAITVSSSNSNAATNSAVLATIADATIAELIVTGQGMATSITVKGLTPGKTTVTVKAADGTASKSFDVIVPVNTDKLEKAITDAEAYFSGANYSAKKITLEELKAGTAEIKLAKALLADAQKYDFVNASQIDVDTKVLMLNALMKVSASDISISIVLSPVPLKDVLTVSGAEVISIVITDMNGKVVATSTSATIDTDMLPSGAYSVTVVTVDGAVTKTVVK